MPLPNEDTTPPVTKTYLVIAIAQRVTRHSIAGTAATASHQEAVL